MQIVPGKIFSKRDLNSLHDFLNFCQTIAKEKGKLQFASICLETKYLDPLAVLQSIYKPQNLSFYFEHPASNFAITATEAILEASFDGPQRFSKVRDFARQVLENTIITGDLAPPSSGPHFFTSFTFADSTKSKVKKENVFPAARVFLPRWQFVRNAQRCLSVVNIPIALEADIESLAQKVWSAYQRVNSLDYFMPPSPPLDKEANEELKLTEVGKLQSYKDAVRTATGYIHPGGLKKIVIARAVDIERNKPFDPLASLNSLREKYPLCFPCFVNNGKGQSFIAAAPERLLKAENNQILTEALAGSAPRGTSLNEDAHLGKTLLENNKNLREHQFVIDSIVEQLRSLHINPQIEAKPRLKQLANVQHLCTSIEADLPEHLHFLDIAATLHPTPAVCGTPLEASRKAIEKIENFDRGLYAGTIGFFDYKGNGELVVSIRSALIDGKKARLYAGCGIVEGSDPQSEWKETEIKLQAILENIR